MLWTIYVTTTCSRHKLMVDCEDRATVDAIIQGIANGNQANSNVRPKCLCVNPQHIVSVVAVSLDEE